MMATKTRPPRRLLVAASQVSIVAVLLAAWQFLPQIESLRSVSSVFDPYFVSSPTDVFDRLWTLTTGGDPTTNLWSVAAVTVLASLLGCLIGTVAGVAVGLALAMNDLAARIARPFVTAFNAMPRVALIPVIVVITGPTTTSSVIAAVLIVFFLVFFNAYEGAMQVPEDVLRNTRILGATNVQQTLRVRFPFVLGWVSAAIPNAIAFSLVAVVTAEILVGSGGIGRLLLNSVTAVDPALTFAIVVFLSAIGIALVVSAEKLQQRLLHWW
jgi:NitT/TauT family transport system permease protein